MFPIVKEIRSKEGKLHFCRWRILETPWFSVYVHLLCESDSDKHLHNHPWNFISIVLFGKYREQLISYHDGYDSWTNNESKQFIPRFRNRNHFHKIEVLEPTISLVITGTRYHDWHYWLSSSRIVGNDVYRDMKRKGLLPI